MLEVADEEAVLDAVLVEVADCDGVVEGEDVDDDEMDGARPEVADTEGVMVLEDVEAGVDAEVAVPVAVGEGQSTADNKLTNPYTPENATVVPPVAGFTQKFPL